jgi:hypothetical protein
MADATVALTGKSLVVGRGGLWFNITGRAVLAHGGVYRLYAMGYARPDQILGFHGQLSGYSLTALGGAQARMELPALTGTGTGLTRLIGRLDAKLPVCTLSITGTVTRVGRANLTLKAPYTLVAYGGATGAGTLPSATLSAHGLTGVVGGVDRPLPRLTLVASGTIQNFGSLDATLPTLQSAGSGVLRSYLPRLTLYAISSSGAAVAYEAYSISLIKDDKGDMACTTRYTTYPFNRIVRFGAKYYGVATDGLYELSGDTFDAAPIVAVVRTGETDFKAREMKRPISLYLAGRVGGDFSVSVNAAEVKDYTYAYHPVNKTGARNYRVFFGKGIRARYLSYAFTNSRGEDFEFDELTPEVAVLRRTA